MFLTRRGMLFLIVSFLLSASATVFAEDAYQSFELEENFLPDPAVGNGTAGGAVDATQHGDTSNGPCVGMIDDTPDHTVTLTASFSYLRFSATASGDTSLVIIGPGGTAYCNDDHDGLNPQVHGAFAAGVYQVYIGSVGGDTPEYTLEISELAE